MTRNDRGHSLILENTIETTDGDAVVTDFMPTRMRGARLIRRVRGVRGSVKFRTELIMRFGYGSIVPWVRRCDDGSLQAVAGPDRLVLRAPLSLRPRGRIHVGEFTVTAEETTDFTLSFSVSYQDVPRAIDPDQALEKTERSWSTWSKSFEGAGQWSEAAIRWLITLIFQDSGGIVAAPHFPAGAIGRFPQLGLPFLLAPRRDLHFARAYERGLRG
jgi:GH15 family glucan-1,4-alpha-glucosidase